MSYQVFARKYRPLTFDDVLGQDHVVRTLKNAISQNRLAHAYLFVGPRGTGKTSTARIFAKALNNSNGPSIDFDPHEDICEEIAEGRSLDVLEIDGASNRGIDHIRDLRDNVRFVPSRGKFRIVYIDEVHMLTKESFNALLKTLEEPPAHVKFIFATTEPHKILPTILSRCQRFDLRPIPTETIAKHLLYIAKEENVELSADAAFAVAKVADGGMRDAQSMLDQLVSFCGNTITEDQVLHIFGITSRETVAKTLYYLLNKDLSPLLHLLHEQAEAGRDMGQLLSEIISSVREILVSKVDPSFTFDSLPQTGQEALMELVNRTKTDKILRLVEVLAETEDKMRWSTNKRLHLEMGLIKAVHTLSEVGISDIITVLNGASLPEITLPLPSAPLSTPAPIVEQIIEPSPSIDSPNASEIVEKPSPEEETLMDEIPTFTSSQDVESIPTEPEVQQPILDKEEAPTPQQQDEVTKVPSAIESFPADGDEATSFDGSESTDLELDSLAEKEMLPDNFIDDSPLAENPVMDWDSEQPEQTTPIIQESIGDIQDIELAIPSTSVEIKSQPISALSDTPVSPPESLLDEMPSASLSQDYGMMSDLFGLDILVESTSSEEKIVEAPKQLTENDWKQAIDSIADQFPLQISFVEQGRFQSHQGGIIEIAYHPLDIQGIESLATGSLRDKLEQTLCDLSHQIVNLTVITDSSVPLPQEPELEPLPAPEPPAPIAPIKDKPKPQAVAQVEEKKEEAPQKDLGEDFYKDPLIEEALNIFHARIVQ